MRRGGDGKEGWGGNEKGDLGSLSTLSDQEYMSNQKCI